MNNRARKLKKNSVSGMQEDRLDDVTYRAVFGDVRGCFEYAADKVFIQNQDADAFRSLLAKARSVIDRMDAQGCPGEDQVFLMELFVYFFIERLARTAAEHNARRGHVQRKAIDRHNHKQSVQQVEIDAVHSHLRNHPYDSDATVAKALNITERRARYIRERKKPTG